MWFNMFILALCVHIQWQTKQMALCEGAIFAPLPCIYWLGTYIYSLCIVRLIKAEFVMVYIHSKSIK